MFYLSTHDHDVIDTRHELPSIFMAGNQTTITRLLAGRYKHGTMSGDSACAFHLPYHVTQHDAMQLLSQILAQTTQLSRGFKDSAATFTISATFPHMISGARTGDSPEFEVSINGSSVTVRQLGTEHISFKTRKTSDGKYKLTTAVLIMHGSEDKVTHFANHNDHTSYNWENISLSPPQPGVKKYLVTATDGFLHGLDIAEAIRTHSSKFGLDDSIAQIFDNTYQTEAEAQQAVDSILDHIRVKIIHAKQAQQEEYLAAHIKDQLAKGREPATSQFAVSLAKACATKDDCTLIITPIPTVFERHKGPIIHVAIDGVGSTGEAGANLACALAGQTTKIIREYLKVKPNPESAHSLSIEAGTIFVEKTYGIATGKLGGAVIYKIDANDARHNTIWPDPKQQIRELAQKLNALKAESVLIREEANGIITLEASPEALTEPNEPDAPDTIDTLLQSLKGFNEVIWLKGSPGKFRSRITEPDVMEDDVTQAVQIRD